MTLKDSWLLQIMFLGDSKGGVQECFGDLTFFEGVPKPDKIVFSYNMFLLSKYILNIKEY